MIRFRVNGAPAPQGSKRHVGNGRMVESSKAVGPWREAVRAEAQDTIEEAIRHEHPGLSCVGERYPAPDAPVSVKLKFVLARPKGHLSTNRKARVMPGLLRPSAPAYPSGRPDVDKLARAVLDGLVMGGVMADDAQVVELSAAKVYASDGQAPGAVIEVEAMG